MRVVSAGGLALALMLGTAGCTRPPFAADPPTRILVFNIHAGKDAGGKSNLDAIAALMKSTGADARAAAGSGSRDTRDRGRSIRSPRSAGATATAPAFAASLLHYDGGEYRHRDDRARVHRLHQTDPLPVTPVQTRAGGSNEPRVALVALATLRRLTLLAVNTHLDPQDGLSRAQEIAQLVDVIQQQQSAGTPFVVGGDFNSTPDNIVLEPLKTAGLRDAWTECGSGDGFTYPADKPAKRIDYLFLAGDLHCCAAAVLDTQVSDHRPVLVTLR